MEYEVRFYYPKTELEDLMKKLSNVEELMKGLRTYEKTVQFNHSDPNYNFYSQEIDGRFRVRISSNDEKTKCKLSWKRRLKDTTETNINKEEENKNLTIKYTDFIVNYTKTKEKVIAIPEEDTVFFDGNNIRVIGELAYYTFENGKKEKIDI